MIVLINLIIIYALLLCSGFGFSYLLTGWHDKRMQLAIALSPIISMSMITIIDVYIIAYSAHPKFLLFSCPISILCLSLILTIGILKTHGNIFKHHAFDKLFFIFPCVILVLALALNNYHNGFLYHGINPDIAAYLASSHWLIQGHSLQQLSGVTVIEIFASALRWGLPALIASVALVTHIFSYQTIFPLAFIILASGSWAIALIYKHTLGELHKPFIIILIAIAILFNGSIISFLAEGFYPSIIAIILLNIFIAFLLVKRNQNSLITIALLTILFLGTLITFYSELYVFSIFVLGGFIFFSVLKRDWDRIQFSAILLLSIILAFFLAFPLSLKIIHFTIANMGNLSNVGYPQPAMVAPSDIIGLTNIYSHFLKYMSGQGTPHFAHRTSLNAFFMIILSFWILYELRVWLKNSLFLTLLTGAICLYIGNIVLIKFSHYGPYNYLYDKLVIDLAPGFIAFFFLGITKHSEKISAKIKIFIALACLTISITAYIINHKKYSTSVDINSAKTIHAQFNYRPYACLANKRGYRQGHIYNKLSFLDRSSEIIMSTMLNDNFFDQIDHHVLKHINKTKKIVLVVDKRFLSNIPMVYKKYKKRILMDTPTYMLIKTNKTIGQIQQGTYQQIKKKIDKLFILG